MNRLKKILFKDIFDLPLQLQTMSAPGLESGSVDYPGKIELIF